MFLLTPVQCLVVGCDENLASLLPAYVMSGLVPTEDFQRATDTTSDQQFLHLL